MLKGEPLRELSADHQELLRGIAEAECRRPEDQAVWLLEQAIDAHPFAQRIRELAGRRLSTPQPAVEAVLEPAELARIIAAFGQPPGPTRLADQVQLERAAHESNTFAHQLCTVCDRRLEVPMVGVYDQQGRLYCSALCRSRGTLVAPTNGNHEPEPA